MCRSSLRLPSLRFVAALVGTLAALPPLACSSSPSGSIPSGAAGDEAAKPSPSPAPTVNPGDQTKDEKDPSTEIIVGIDAENFRSQGYLVDLLDVVAKVDGVVAAKETLEAEKVTLFPREVRLLAPKAKPDALVEIEVTARDKGSLTSPSMPPIVSRRATARFVKGKSLLAYVFLEVRCNTFPMMGGGGPSGPTCAAPTTCIGGACRSAELGPLPDYRTDWAKNPPSACGTGTPEIEIAQGETKLEPLADGATIALERGPQCGHHLWLAVRMKNLAQSGTTTVLSATQPGGGVTVPATGFPYAYAGADGGACEIAGLRFQVDASGAQAAAFLGKPLDLTIEATDKAGRKATAVRHVVVANEVKITPGLPCP